MPPIRGITISVGYDDLLTITLPRAMRHLSECLVVTSPDDERTKALALSIPNVRVFETDAFTRYGARFNKGLAMEEAFDAIGRDGWLLIWDADIVFPDALDLSKLRSGCLHGARRRMLDDASKWTPTFEWKNARMHFESPFIGYFQLFHGADPHLQGKRPWYDPTFAHAGGADAYFITHWPAGDRRSLGIEVLHLGPRDTNWFGRASERLDGAENPEAVERKDCMDAFVVRNGWTRRQPHVDHSATERVGNLIERVNVPGYPATGYEIPFVRCAKTLRGET